MIPIKIHMLDGTFLTANVRDDTVTVLVIVAPNRRITYATLPEDSDVWVEVGVELIVVK